MNNFLSDFNDFGGIFDNLLGWDKSYYAFNRPIKDLFPYKEKHLKDKDVLVFNVVGLSKDDISVKVEKEGQINYLNINGEKTDKMTEEPYNIKARFSIDTDKIANITYKVENGLLYVNLFYKEPKKSNIEINYEK